MHENCGQRRRGTQRQAQATRRVRRGLEPAAQRLRQHQRNEHAEGLEAADMRQSHPGRAEDQQHARRRQHQPTRERETEQGEQRARERAERAEIGRTPFGDDRERLAEAEDADGPQQGIHAVGCATARYQRGKPDIVQ